MGIFSNIKKLFKKENEEKEEENLLKDNNVQEEVEEDKSIQNNLQEENLPEDNSFEEMIKQDNLEETKEEFQEKVKLYDKGLSKSRDNFVNKLINLNNRTKKITDEYFEELEDILIMADIGVNTVLSFIERLKKRVKSENITDLDYLKEVIVDELFIIYVDNSILTNKLKFNETGPTVILFVGVNGVGKTTTIGKIASQLKNKGKKVLMVAGDTFRAGAI